MKQLLSYILFSFISCLVFGASPLSPGRLFCEYIVNPVGIDVATPRLSWTLVSASRNQVQTAYEIIVGENSRALSQPRDASWQSGKISSSESVHITYAGRP